MSIEHTERSKSGPFAISALLAAALIPAVALATPAPEIAALSFEPPAQPAVSDQAKAPALPDPDAPKPWTIQIDPLLWYVAPSGNVKLPVTSGTGPGGFTTQGDKVSLAALALDGPRMRPAGQFHISADKWRFSFAGSDDSNSRDAITAKDTFRLGAVAVAPGDKLDVDFHFGTYELTVGYEIWDRDFQASSEHPDKAIPLVIRIYALGGARLYDVGLGIVREAAGATPMASSRSDEYYGEPIIGLRAEADFTKGFGIDVQVSGGAQPFGNHNSYSIDIVAGFHWRPIDNLAFQIGYRQLAFDLGDGKDLGQFDYKGRIAGLFVGLDIRF